MSDFLIELVDYVAAQGGGTVPTTSNNGDLFTNELPPDPDNCVAFFGLQGGIIGDQRQVASLNFPRFQVLVRNKVYATGSAKLALIRSILHAKYGIVLTSWRIMACHAEQEGGPIGTDDQDRFEFAINFAAEVNAEP